MDQSSLIFCLVLILCKENVNRRGSLLLVVVTALEVGVATGVGVVSAKEPVLVVMVELLLERSCLKSIMTNSNSGLQRQR